MILAQNVRNTQIFRQTDENQQYFHQFFTKLMKKHEKIKKSKIRNQNHKKNHEKNQNIENSFFPNVENLMKIWHAKCYRITLPGTDRLIKHKILCW